jgi:signal peptidase I
MSAAPRAVRLSVVLTLVLAAVWLFWPSGLGGGTVYVTTHGISMEPRFHTGDLAIIRAADHYSVGDVVAYQSVSLQTIVMHRIVSRDGDRFVIQGDNNSWLDQDRPTKNEILGSLFLRVPQGGETLATLSSPGALAILASAALVLAGMLRAPRGRHGAVRRIRRATSRRGRPSFSTPVRARGRQAALVSGAVALVAAAGCVALLVMPSTSTDTRTLEVTQQGRFSYTGQAVPGTTYPTGVIATGETVWTRLARGLTISFQNSVTGPGLSDVRGTIRLDVSVSAPDGWTAIVTSGSVTAMANGTGTASVLVDSAAAAALLSRHYAEIGVSGGNGTLTITPVAETVGKVQGHAFTAGSPAGLTFSMDGTSLRPLPTAGAGFAPSSQVPIKVDHVAPRRLTVLAISIPVGLARVASVAILVVALMVLGAAAWIGRAARGDAADEFVVKHAGRILPVAAFDPGPTVIDVSDAEALHRVAERFDTLVLHHAGADEDVFAVRDVDATYRFVVPGGREARARPPVPVRVRVPEAADVTTPLPLIVPASQTSVSAGLWGKFA